jgi:hypothetical protein
MNASGSINITGKDWLTEAEGAFYCGVCLKTFRKGCETHGIVARNPMGRKLYSKDELYRMIQQAAPWQNQLSNGVAKSPISHLSKGGSVIAELLARSRPQRQRGKGQP